MYMKINYNFYKLINLINFFNLVFDATIYSYLVLVGYKLFLVCFGLKFPLFCNENKI